MTMTATMTATTINETPEQKVIGLVPSELDNPAQVEHKSIHADQLFDTSSSSSKRQARKLAKFYEGKTVFVTGATGFIGKVFLVKMMSSLSTCSKVFVLLRSKKGMSPQQRFNKLLSEDPFKTTSSNASIDWSKIVAVDGDMSSECLGLSEADMATVCGQVDIVFNIAASVQFDAPLKQNLRDNYLGARNALHLASKMDRLVSYVHVSTFYSNSHLSHIEEKVLPMNRDCEKMAELISWVPDSLCEAIAPQIMESRPNTYIFTKAMAENLVQKYQGKLPIAILRPSIVTPSVKEPSPGWVDNVNGPMGLGVLASLGILRNIDWNYYGVADFIPVDMVVNSMLAVAERTARLHPNEIKVYNCSSSSLNPTTWGGVFETLRKESMKAPPYKMLRVPIAPPRHKRANKIGFAMTKLNELLFAYFIDFILMVCGQKQLLTKLTSKLHHGYEILKPFTTTEYTCSNDNLMAAYDELDPEDKIEFNFNVPKLDWNESFLDAYYGARSRLLKEDISNLPAAVFKMKILMVVEFVFKCMLVALTGWTSYRLYGYYSQQSLSAL